MNHTFYELKHEISADYFTIEQCRDFSFPLHLHRCYEIILLLEGSMTVCMERKEYRLMGGDMILVKPNFIHSLETVGSSRHILCIFAPELIAAISEPLNRYRLSSAVIRGVPHFYHELFEGMTEDAHIGRIKGFLYMVSSLFYEQLDLTVEDPDTGGKHLMRDIFRYVDKNMEHPCSLQDLGEELGYSPAYLSRFFHADVGMPYSEYVRNVKISHACYLLRNTAEPVTEIATRCGYISSTSFNRNFKKITTINPTEYRMKLKIT